MKDRSQESRVFYCEMPQMEQGNSYLQQHRICKHVYVVRSLFDVIRTCGPKTIESSSITIVTTVVCLLALLSSTHFNIYELYLEY